MPLSFQELRRSVPSVHVSDKHGAPSTLFPQPQDEDSDLLYFSAGDVVGKGFQHAPYRFKCASATSPHHAITGMWFELQVMLEVAPAEFKIFIEVSDWVLQVTREGVIAQDGTLTRFV